MKKLFCLFLAVAIILTLCACQGNFSSINLEAPVQIPEDGVISQATIQKIKDENTIAIFTGTSGDFKYEWTVFGSAIHDAKTVNLNVQLTNTTDRNIHVVLTQSENFGFSSTIAIHLNEQWDAQDATAYVGEQEFMGVSITGSKYTILNLNLDGAVGEFTIRPNPMPEEQPSTGDSESDDTDDSIPVTSNPETETIPATTPSEPPQPTEQPIMPETNTQPSIPQTNTEPTTEPTKPAENGGKDKYFTDPVPEGKPNPVEPEDQEIDTNITYTCTFSIECSTILNNLEMLELEKLEMVPYNGVILAKIEVTFYEGESVFDVLQRVCKDNNIHMEAEWTPIYNSAYIEGIHNLYEFDCGALSGWMYKVNGWYPNYGCSRYQLCDGDIVEWRYTCDLGNDIGGGYAIGG